MQEIQTRLSEGVLDPKVHCPVQLQPAELHQLGYFPAAQKRDLSLPRGGRDVEAGVARHRCASQSSLATGSNGSRYSRTESRRGLDLAGERRRSSGKNEYFYGFASREWQVFQDQLATLYEVASIQCASTPSV